LNLPHLMLQQQGFSSSNPFSDDYPSVKSTKEKKTYSNREVTKNYCCT
jgi:hypothetical protein